MPSISPKSVEYDAPEFAARLQSAIHTIRMAYPELLNRIEEAVMSAFEIDTSLATARDSLRERAKYLQSHINESALKALCGRLSDSSLEKIPWIESLGNLLAKKSPERWMDQDEDEFLHQLSIMSGRFKRTEFLHHHTSFVEGGMTSRIAITRSDGSEVGHLIDRSGLDDKRIHDARGEVATLLDRLGTHGLAATLDVLWERLDLAPNAKGINS